MMQAVRGIVGSVLLLTVFAGSANAQMQVDPPVRWKWAENSPTYSVVDPFANPKTYTISASGQVEYLKGVGITIQEVKFIVYRGVVGLDAWEVTPDTDETVGTLGVVNDLPPTQNYVYRSVTANPIKKGGNDALYTSGTKLKIVARIKAKMGTGANDPVVTADYDPPGYVTIP